MLIARLVTLSVLLLGACDSKVTSAADADLLKRLETVQDCFPALYPKAQALLDVAETWRLDSGVTIPDPPGLTWNVQNDGSLITEILVTFVSGDCTLQMAIRFYSPDGIAQDLDLSGATSLADAIDRAATELGVLFPNTDKFMVGDWTLTGPGISGTGALTGIIGGSTNQNELEELRTTTATPVGGPPPNADSTVIDAGPPECSLTFNTTSLLTDTDPTQQYPIGVIDVTIVGPEATVTATITFDDTVIARIAVDDVPGRFDFDLGVPTFTVSGFAFEEEGTGTLAKNFGGNPLLSAGANVNSDLELSNAKASLVFDIPLGPVTISPGLAADWFDFNFEVTQVNGLASELVELEAPVPIGVLRAAADLGVLSGMAEIGYVEADIDDVEAKFVDIDVMVTLHATDVLDLLVGYRYLSIDGDGLIDDDTFFADITLDGIVIGGGVRF